MPLLLPHDVGNCGAGGHRGMASRRSRRRRERALPARSILGMALLPRVGGMRASQVRFLLREEQATGIHRLRSRARRPDEDRQRPQTGPARLLLGSEYGRHPRSGHDGAGRPRTAGNEDGRRGGERLRQPARDTVLPALPEPCGGARSRFGHCRLVPGPRLDQPDIAAPCPRRARGDRKARRKHHRIRPRAWDREVVRAERRCREAHHAFGGKAEGRANRHRVRVHAEERRSPGRVQARQRGGDRMRRMGLCDRIPPPVVVFRPPRVLFHDLLGSGEGERLRSYARRSGRHPRQARKSRRGEEDRRRRSRGGALRIRHRIPGRCVFLRRGQGRQEGPRPREPSRSRGVDMRRGGAFGFRQDHHRQPHDEVLGCRCGAHSRGGEGT